MLSAGASTNSILRTAWVINRLITAKYRGARACSSDFQRCPETSTRNTPSSKLKARVRSATAEPQTTGQAMSGASARGASRNDCATIFSKPEPACSKCSSSSTRCRPAGHFNFNILSTRRRAPGNWVRAETRGARNRVPRPARAIALPTAHLLRRSIFLETSARGCGLLG
jgi:hypothetical protein